MTGPRTAPITAPLTAAGGPFPPRGPARLVYLLGILVLLAGACYWLFAAADGLALSRHTDVATVVGKTHREAGTTYTTEIINGRPYPTRHTTPEAYVLQLALPSGRAEGTTDRELYAAVAAGDRVRVTYARRRVTGAIQVLDVER